MAGNTHRVFYKEDGSAFTVAKDYEDKFLNMGYTLGPESKGGARWHIDEAIRNDTAGSNWKDNGYNNGDVWLKRPGQDPNSAGYSNVNARYADKYFDKGYYLDSRSQSVNRALDSDFFRSYDRANSAAKNGSYDFNSNYSSNYDEGHGYRYDGQYNDNYYDAINRLFNNMNGRFEQENLALQDQLSELTNKNKLSNSSLNQLIEEFNQYKSSYSDNQNSYINNNQGYGSQGDNANYSSRSISNNNMVLPGQIFVGNSGKKVIRENGVDREMNDDEVVQYLDSIYGF